MLPLPPQQPVTPVPDQTPQVQPAPMTPPPLDPNYAGTLEQREQATERLMELLRKYKDHRESFIEPVWNETWRAYIGTPPADNAPHGSFYHIAEIFRQVEVLKPQLAAQLLPPEPFKYLPEGDEDIFYYKAQAATKLVRKLISRNDLDQELLAWLDNVSLWGTSYLMYGWKQFKRVRRKIAKCVRKEDERLKSAWERKTEETLEEGFSLRWVNHWQVYTDYRCPRLEESPAVFLVEYVTVEELKTMVENGELDEKVVKEAIEAGPGASREGEDFHDRPEDDRTFDENDHPNPDGLYSLCTVWTNDGGLYSILQEKYMARAQYNAMGRVPILCLRNYPQPTMHYGWGEPFMLLWDQKLLDDTASQWFDSIKLTNNPMFVVAAAAKKKWEVVGFKAGGAVFPDNVDQIKPLTTPQTTFPIGEAMATLRRNMQLATGNTDEQMGVTKHRTAGGIKLLQDAAGMRINHKVRWHMPVFKRLWLELYELCARFLEAEFSMRVAGRDGREFVQQYGPDAFEPEIDVKVELPNESEDPVAAQSRALQFYTQTTGSGDPRWKFRPCADVLVRAFKPDAHTSEFYADELEDAKSPLYENDVWRISGTLPEVQPDENHQLHIQLHGAELQTAIQGGLPPEWLQAMSNHLERHMQIFEAITGAQTQQAAATQPVGGEESGSPYPPSDGATEAGFANGMTGAAEQGAMTGAIQ